jgi:hypothetical protein
MHTYDTLSEALDGPKLRGYTEDFNLQGHCIECAAQSLQLHPEDFVVDEYYRFEGPSNPDDNSIVYAISSKNGLRGTLVDAYGVYSEEITPEMVEKLKVKHS